MSTSKKHFELNASTLRIILILSLFVVTGLAVAGFTYGQGILDNFAIEVSKTKVDAKASDGTIASLQKIKTELEANIDTKAKLDELKSSGEFPEFTIYKLVNKYAKQNNLSIATFEFKSAAPAAAPTPGGTSTPTTPQTTPTTAPATSQGTVAVTVSLASPANYKNYLQFVHDLEQSLPKMQISGVSLTPGAGPSTVGIESMTIEMYTSKG